MKLVTYASYEGHWFAMPRHRWSNAVNGTEISSTSSVIATANTPSLNASVRAVSKRLVMRPGFAPAGGKPS